MLLAYLILASALSISGVAIYFSIAGLTTIFPGAFWPIVIMGTVLELGKLVCASWLHHNWKEAPRMLKAYLTTAVVVLIFITSMGIFGFLSKSHIEQQRDLDQANSSISQLENKINNEKGYISRQENFISKIEKSEVTSSERTDFNIELEQQKIKDLETSLATSISYDQEEISRIEARISTLNAEVAALTEKGGGLFSNKKQKLQDLKDSQAAERALLTTKKTKAESNIASAREKTTSEVSSLRARISEYQEKGEVQVFTDPKVEGHENKIREGYERIEEWEAEKFKVQSSISELEVEVGPIKYIAALVEDMGVENLILAEAVRIVILILVFVFDPLAVVMLLAANMNFRKVNQPSYEKLSKQLNNTKKDAPPKPTIKEVIKEVEVPVEVIKEVEVPVEVIKEVEVPVEVIKEVIKEVEVIKEIGLPPSGEDPFSKTKVLKF